MMFKVYYINMLNVVYYVGTVTMFERNLLTIRKVMQAGEISGWQIQRASDGVILAESKSNHG